MEQKDIQWVKKELEKNKRELWETYGYVSAGMGRYNVDGMHLLSFMVCLKPESPAFGMGAGVFEYKGTVYWFHYDVSGNKMAGLEEVAVETREGTEKELCFRHHLTIGGLYGRRFLFLLK